MTTKECEGGPRPRDLATAFWNVTRLLFHFCCQIHISKEFGTMPTNFVIFVLLDLSAHPPKRALVFSGDRHEKETAAVP